MYYRILLVLIIVTVNSCCGMDFAEKKVEKKIVISDKSHIIFLNGTTTAGKSSIALKLKAQLEKQKRPSLLVEVLALDTFVMPKLVWTLVKNRLNIFNFSLADEDLLTPLEVQEISKKSHIEMCTAAKAAYKQGKIVIVDVPAYRLDQIAFYQKELTDFKATWSLVYCPVSTLVERVINRNKTSGITEQRSILQALDQFNHLYCSTDLVFDTLSQENLYATCNRAQTQHVIMQNEIPSWLKGIQKAICPISSDNIQDLMSKNFTLNCNTKINIGPIRKHDCIVNTEFQDPALCAEVIINAVAIKQNGDRS